jgi:murein DD-endopeptidase MepM/ murein hydrolase activator NlpD
MPLKTAVVSFVAGMITMAAIGWNFRSRDAVISPTEIHPTIETVPDGTPASPATDAAPAAAIVPAEADGKVDGVVGDLKERDLILPVEGVSREDLRDTFHEVRGAGRQHEAMDILAPRHTPVVAVEDGTIAKLFSSKLGGITVYQFDPSQRFAYYYAHLERYADGLDEGRGVKRGQVLGYVGTSGNAPKDTPHLHFAIFELTPERQWWKGTAIDPFTVFR